MMAGMRRMLAIAFAVALFFATPLSALADDAAKTYDGRLEVYGKNVTLDIGSTALMWLSMLGLTIVALGVLFKSPNRSHLD
jgi:hypothetical protein